MPQLSDYEAVVGTHEIDDLRLLAAQLKGKRVVHINSTAVGGGVAEILNRMVPLFNELGVNTRWDVIKGGEEFYAVTKKFHNALHGESPTFQQEEFKLFMDVQEQNLKNMVLDEHIVFVHDPQPIGLVEKKKTHHNQWIWRCHVDVSDPNPEVWNFLVTA